MDRVITGLIGLKIELMPEASHVYRKDDCVKDSTPDGVAHHLGNDVFYKHANPLGLAVNPSLQMMGDYKKLPDTAIRDGVLNSSQVENSLSTINTSIYRYKFKISNYGANKLF